MFENNSSSNEIWKDIAGYENKYQISMFGFKRLDRILDTILKEYQKEG